MRSTRSRCTLLMPLDIQKYLHHLEEFDLSEERKRELIQTVWQVMEGFVDRAFGKHPVQQLRNRAEKILQDSPGILESKDTREGSD